MEMTLHLAEKVLYKTTFQFPECQGLEIYDWISIFPFCFQIEIIHFEAVGFIKTLYTFGNNLKWS